MSVLLVRDPMALLRIRNGSTVRLSDGPPAGSGSGDVYVQWEEPAEPSDPDTAVWVRTAPDGLLAFKSFLGLPDGPFPTHLDDKYGALLADIPMDDISATNPSVASQLRIEGGAARPTPGEPPRGIFNFELFETQGQGGWRILYRHAGLTEVDTEVPEPGQDTTLNITFTDANGSGYILHCHTFDKAAMGLSGIESYLNIGHDIDRVADVDPITDFGTDRINLMGRIVQRSDIIDLWYDPEDTVKNFKGSVNDTPLVWMNEPDPMFDPSGLEYVNIPINSKGPDGLVLRNGVDWIAVTRGEFFDPELLGVYFWRPEQSRWVMGVKSETPKVPVAGGSGGGDVTLPIGMSDVTALTSTLANKASNTALSNAIAAVMSTLEDYVTSTVLAGAIADIEAEILALDFVTDVELAAAVSAGIAGVIDVAPGALDTLNELAAALGDDPNFANTITTLIGTKVDKTTTVNGHALSSNVVVTKADVGLGNVSDLTPANMPVSTAQAAADGAVATAAATDATTKANAAQSAATAAAASDATTKADAAQAAAIASAIASSVQKSLYDANSILAATLDDTPVALSVAASRVVGRKSTGGISSLTPAELLAILSTSGTPTGFKFLRDDNTLAEPGMPNPLLDTSSLTLYGFPGGIRTASNSTSTALSANTLYVAPIIVSSTITVTGGVWNVGTAAASGKHVLFYIANSAGVPVGTLGAPLADSTGAKTITGAGPIVLTPGLYYVVTQPEASVSLIRANVIVPNVSNLHTGFINGDLSYLSASSTYSGTAPSSFPTLSGSQVSGMGWYHFIALKWT